MANGISERDWKVFKELHAVALDRMFERALGEVRAGLDLPAADLREKYWRISELVRKLDKEITGTFDDYRRSTVWLQAPLIYSMGLLTKEEMRRFSPEILRGIEGFGEEGD